MVNKISFVSFIWLFLIIPNGLGYVYLHVSAPNLANICESEEFPKEISTTPKPSNSLRTLWNVFSINNKIKTYCPREYQKESDFLN